MSQKSKLRIQRPCSIRWEDLEGDDKARFCHRCQDLVYNLDDISEREAQSLRAAHPKGFCGTYLRPPKAGVAAAAILASAFLGCSEPTARSTQTADESPAASEASPDTAGLTDAETDPKWTEEQLEQLRRLVGYV